MIEIQQDLNRNIVPRWRSFGAARRFGELKPTGKSQAPQFTKADLYEVLEDWRRQPGLSVACDVVSIAFAHGLGAEVVDIADYILANDVAPKRAREIASKCMAGRDATVNSQFTSLYPVITIDHVRDSIRSIRRRLSSHPYNPVLWSNLALCYATLGLSHKAERAMTVAYQLGPECRFVLRSAARYFIHAGDLEHAHHLLSKSPNVAKDPWILSAELGVATARNRSSRFTERARRLLGSQDHGPFELSEMASALCTMEAINGKMRTAKALGDQSLVEPAENAVAQTAWLSRNLGLNVFMPSSVPQLSSEAEAWSAQQSEKWPEALRAAIEWQTEQPFSRRPALCAGVSSLPVTVLCCDLVHVIEVSAIS